jgi:hypothetical protein
LIEAVRGSDVLIRRICIAAVARPFAVLAEAARVKIQHNAMDHQSHGVWQLT